MIESYESRLVDGKMKVWIVAACQTGVQNLRFVLVDARFVFH